GRAFHRRILRGRRFDARCARPCRTRPEIVEEGLAGMAEGPGHHAGRGLMMRRFRFLPVVAACLITAGAAFAGAPQGKTAAFNDAQKKEIETIVRDYLIRHPEVMIDVMQALDAKQTQAKEEQRSDVLSSRRGDIYNSPDDFVAGNPDGDVTIVEFFDYQCGYCKRAFGPLMETLEKDGNVRLVLKEFPILGPASVTASHAAVASMRQG